MNGIFGPPLRYGNYQYRGDDPHQWKEHYDELVESLKPSPDENPQPDPIETEGLSASEMDYASPEIVSHDADDAKRGKENERRQKAREKTEREKPSPLPANPQDRQREIQTIAAFFRKKGVTIVGQDGDVAIIFSDKAGTKELMAALKAMFVLKGGDQIDSL